MATVITALKANQNIEQITSTSITAWQHMVSDVISEKSLELGSEKFIVVALLSKVDPVVLTQPFVDGLFVLDFITTPGSVIISW